jgi:hypothetical protein
LCGAPYSRPSHPWRCLNLPLFEEVVALVVDDNESREIFDIDLPHRLHPKLRVLKDLASRTTTVGERPKRESEKGVSVNKAKRLRTPTN